MSRLINLRLGREGPIQHFSLSRPNDDGSPPVINNLEAYASPTQYITNNEDHTLNSQE
jgi:hypothetical protein